MKGTIRGFIAGILCASLVLIPCMVGLAKTGEATLTAAYRDIKIKINGEMVTPKDVQGNTVEPFIVDGTTYLPVRAVAGALGFSVSWDSDTSTVIIGDDNSNKNETDVLYEDSNIKAVYKKTEIFDGIEAFYVTIEVLNKSEKDITVYLRDASINNEMISLVMSGTPMDILKGKSAQNAFIFPNSMLSVKTVEDIKNIEFKMWVVNKDNLSDTIVETESLNIDF